MWHHSGLLDLSFPGWSRPHLLVESNGEHDQDDVPDDCKIGNVGTENGSLALPLTVQHEKSWVGEAEGDEDGGDVAGDDPGQEEAPPAEPAPGGQGEAGGQQDGARGHARREIAYVAGGGGGRLGHREAPERQLKEIPRGRAPAEGLQLVAEVPFGQAAYQLPSPSNLSEFICKPTPR